LVRGGERGDREPRALAEGRVIAGWKELSSIEDCKTREQVEFRLRQVYPETSANIIANWTGQLWRFKDLIQAGDLVVMPLKTQPGQVAIGRVVGPYRFEADEPEGFRQVRDVQWLRDDIPRESIRPDLRASISSLLTVCGLTRYEAARRIAELAESGVDPGVDGGEEVTNSEQLLTDAAAQVAAEPRRLTIRDFLEHWGETRRTGGVIAKVKADLADAGLTTRPPFTEGSIDREIEIVSTAGDDGTPAEVAEETEGTEDVDTQLSSTLRIGSLPPADLVSIPPNASLTYAKTLMLRRKFSQLAIIDESGVCFGAVSWESIGKAHIASANPTLADALSLAPIVDHDAHLLDQIGVIYDRDFVFVRNADQSTVSGIVTAADLTRQFGEFSRPFVHIEEAEGRLRRRADEVYSVEDLKDAVQPGRRSRVNHVTDLSFGDYRFLIEPEARWAKLEWDVDQGIFLSLLEEVRKTRNDLMHFTPDPLAAEQYAALEGLLELLRTVDPRP
jgi:restriction system protein